MLNMHPTVLKLIHFKKYQSAKNFFSKHEVHLLPHISYSWPSSLTSPAVCITKWPLCISTYSDGFGYPKLRISIFFHSLHSWKMNVNKIYSVRNSNCNFEMTAQDLATTLICIFERKLKNITKSYFSD